MHIALRIKIAYEKFVVAEGGMLNTALLMSMLVIWAKTTHISLDIISPVFRHLLYLVIPVASLSCDIPINCAI